MFYILYPGYGWRYIFDPYAAIGTGEEGDYQSFL